MEKENKVLKAIVIFLLILVSLIVAKDLTLFEQIIVALGICVTLSL